MKETHIEGVWLRVDVSSPLRGLNGNKDKAGRILSPSEVGKLVASDLVESIKRHCDGFDDIFIMVDSEEVCSYCGFEWEEDEDSSPMCCDKALEEFKAKHST